MIVPPTSANIQLAAQMLENGELIGMPTETVYGIAASLNQPEAVARIFRVKGRPEGHPLIVHLAKPEQGFDLSSDIGPYFERLASAFWPGPLTMVLPKSDRVPSVATGGLDTVAIRVPKHPVALELLSILDAPVTAPSANRFTRLSPTQAGHIDREIAEHLALILDGGQCQVGIESTVLDLTGETPRILRPGHITPQMISQVVGVDVCIAGDMDGNKSPGLHPKHYSPRATVVLCESLSADQSGLTFDAAENANQISMPKDPVAYAARLYSELQKLDDLGVDHIFIAAPPVAPAWTAVWDRIKRSAHP